MGKKNRLTLHVAAILTFVFLGFLALGSTQTAPAPAAPVAPVAAVQITALDIFRVPWSQHTFIPNKDYVAVGMVVINDVNDETLLADLMDRAIAMGGHDIINVRLGMLTETRTVSRVVTAADGTSRTLTDRETHQRVNTATATVIRYTAGTFTRMVPGPAQTTPAPDGIRRVPWSHHTYIVNKNFTVVGAVSLRNVNEATVLADIMNGAVALGGHDVINVRVGMVADGEGNARMSTATAVVIQYTAETWTPPGREISMPELVPERIVPQAALPIPTLPIQAAPRVSAAPPILPERQPQQPQQPRQPQGRVTGNSPRLNSLGAFFVSGSATGGAARVTLAPANNFFLEGGLELSRGRAQELDSDYHWFIYRENSAVHPYINAGVFVPFQRSGGWYAGGGIGLRFVDYEIDHGYAEGNQTLFAVNLTTGFNFWNWFDLSYTLQTNFRSASHRVAIGFVYRFMQRS